MKESALLSLKNKIVEAAQARNNLTSFNERREIDGLINAMKKFNLKKGYVLTENQEEERVADNLKIDIMPAWKYCLK